MKICYKCVSVDMKTKKLKLLEVLHVGILYCYFLDNVLVSVLIVMQRNLLMRPPNTSIRQVFLVFTKTFASGNYPLTNKIPLKLKSRDTTLIYGKTLNYS